MMHNRARQLHDAVAARNPIFNVKLCGACQGHGFLSTCLQDRGSCDKLTSRPRLTALAESTHGPCLLIHWRICEPEILSKLNLHIQNSAMVRVFMDAPKVRCGCTCAHACMHACMRAWRERLGLHSLALHMIETTTCSYLFFTSRIFSPKPRIHTPCQTSSQRKAAL